MLGFLNQTKNQSLQSFPTKWKYGIVFDTDTMSRQVHHFLKVIWELIQHNIVEDCACRPVQW